MHVSDSVHYDIPPHTRLPDRRVIDATHTLGFGMTPCGDPSCDDGVVVVVVVVAVVDAAAAARLRYAEPAT